MYDAIMVPLDGSSFGEQALRPAAAIAERAGADVHLVHARMSVDFGALPDDSAIDPTANERRYMEAAAKRIAERVPGTVATAVLEDVPPAGWTGPQPGWIAEALTRYADAHRIDLTVMTTHGRGPITRAWLGSIADAFVRHAGMPVLLLRPHDEEDEAGGADVGRWGAERAVRHVLVALDGSENGERILPPAVTLAGLWDAEITLMRTVAPHHVVGEPFMAPTMHTDVRTLEEQRAAASDYVETVAGRLREELEDEAVPIHTAVPTSETPPAGLLDYADANRVDLIALATHGRGGVSRAVLGSVADKVIRAAEVPVLVYRPPTARDDE